MSTQEIEQTIPTLGAAELQRLTALMNKRLNQLYQSGEAVASSQEEILSRAMSFISDGTGPAISDLSSNPAHMEGFGQRALS